MKEKKRINKENARMGGILRILIPKEFDLIKKQPRKYENEFLLDLLLNTGMRFAEIQRFVENVNKSHQDEDDFDWFEPARNKIILPNYATKTNVTREVLLTPDFSNQLKQYIKIRGKIEIPTIQTLDESLKRWAKKANISKSNIIAVKTFRKTWESYLVNSGKNALVILSSQGHSNAVALQSYIKIGFTPEEKAEMMKRTQGWGE